ncbi:MAG: ribosomal-processing cysteine protease Prp, partial [Treponema sp.]|nr:ribosomal-processing cysteine protease Prp [Treponema sp.]
AAVSVLMRTAVRALSGKKGVTVRCDAPEPGIINLEAGYTAEGRGFLYAAGVFLTEGLASVAEEYPENCKLTIRRT